MPHELKGREILAVGTWNGIEFSEADLDDIAENFVKLKDSHKVPLKFGHNKDQKITDGQPAIGWVSRVFRQGEKLFADFSDMPRTVFEAIKNKLYRAVSIELLFNVDSKGKKFNHVLDAVALLGSDHPAVKSLADLDALMATRTSFAGGHRLMFETIAGKKAGGVVNDNHFVIIDEEGDMPLEMKDVEAMLDKKMKPVMDENAKLQVDLKASQSEVTKLKADSDKRESDEKEAAVKLARKNVTDILDDAVKQKSLTPAAREVYEEQAGVADDERVVKIDLAKIKVLFSVSKDDKQTGMHKSGDDETDDPEAEMMALTRKNMADTGEKDFTVAFALVSTANPKLHLEYLNANGEVN